MGNTALLFNIILSIYILFSFTATQSAPESALVTELPGFDGTFPSKHYSRYVPLVGTSEKKLFYYFVLSERNTLEDPVVSGSMAGRVAPALMDSYMSMVPSVLKRESHREAFQSFISIRTAGPRIYKHYSLVSLETLRQVCTTTVQVPGLLRDGGIATSLTNTRQQWDFPNGWAPLQHMIVEGLVKSGSKKARFLAEDIVVRWIRTNYAAYKETGT